MRPPVGRSRWLAVLGAGLLGCFLMGPPQVTVAQPAEECRDWLDSGVADPRFKVWACKGGDPDAAEADIARVAALVEEIWGPMTQPVPTGMGEPLPDGVGTNVDLEHGRDPRIDFYALLPGQAVYRGGRPQSIKSSSAAAAGVSLLDESARGPRPNGASGYVLVDRSRLPDPSRPGDDVAMRQDLIHEFFHVLQYAHNGYAPFRDPSHWFVEASATWAETYYLRDHSEEPHRWFETFQASAAGLEDPDVQHRYSAYIWPFFMEQELGRDAIMQAWAGTDGLGPGSDYDAVTDVIDAQLPFADRFRDFAVRNLNNDQLAEDDTVYEELDQGFHHGVEPGHMGSGSVSPGSPYVSQLSMPALSARYAHLSFPEEAREIKVSIAGVSPESAVDGDLLVHYADGWWERQPMDGVVKTYCRDDDDIDALYVVVSNHDRDATVSGPLEVSAKDTCTGDEIVLEGTIHGTRSEANSSNNYFDTRATYELTMQVTITLSEHDWTAEGTATVSGEYTGNCHYEDSDSGEFFSDMRNTVPPDFSDMVASVQVYSSDPRFTQRPIPGLHIGAHAVTADVGGTCGYAFGSLEDAFPALQVGLGSCDLEILNDEGTWHGDCHEVSPDTAYYGGGPMWETRWTANFEQISPEP